MATRRRHLKPGRLRLILNLARLGILSMGFVICSFTFMLYHRHFTIAKSQMTAEEVWKSAPFSGGKWIPLSAPRSEWPPPPRERNGYLHVRCNGGLNQQRSAICNAVVAARIMNATLVLPELDSSKSLWQGDSGFQAIYDVEHFIQTLRNDVHIVMSMPESEYGKLIDPNWKGYLLHPPREAPLSWYTKVALPKMKKYGSIYLSPFAHRLDEEITNPEYQRLRCRVNYHALRFKPHIMELSDSILNTLKSQGRFIAIHLRFEMDMLAFAGCFDIFTPAEQETLKAYREQNFAPKKKLNPTHRRSIGKCPLTPEEVGLILRSMGFDNTTTIYLAGGDLFGGERYLKPLRSLFPHLKDHSTVNDLLAGDERGVLGSAVDYMVCLNADIFMPTYDGPSNFANNLLGHRLYDGLKRVIRPDRKRLAPVLIEWLDKKKTSVWFEQQVRKVMRTGTSLGHKKRVLPESFYTNPWPECFCKPDDDEVDSVGHHNKCPVVDNAVEVFGEKIHFHRIQDRPLFQLIS